MRIIRPYGSSRSKETDHGLRRVLVEKGHERAEHDIADFARSHDELIIAQWISVIDKIARKPQGLKKPSAEQRAIRDRLGDACWMRLTEGGHVLAACHRARGSDAEGLGDQGAIRRRYSKRKNARRSSRSQSI